MTKRTQARRIAVTALFLAAAALVVGAGAPQLELSWTTIDGGGGTAVGPDGTLELSGTIGQPDAGEMAGGGFTLTGGFWFPVVAGDCNVDGGVNLFDYGDFSPCLTGPGDAFATPDCVCFDLDGDQDVDLSDVGQFQQGFTGG